MLPLSESSYWTRAWTLQEYSHSSTRILCLNSEYASTPGMHSSAEMLGTATNTFLHRQLFLLNRLEEPSHSRSIVLSINLPEVIKMECSEPRDKVFALRELCLHVFGGITVDYNQTVEDIFTEASRCLILDSQNLEVLYTSCSCRKLYDVLGRQEGCYDIPSWAIDWTGASEGGLYRSTRGGLQEEESWHRFATRSGLHQEDDLPATFSDDGLRLKLSGMCFSQVSKCVSDRIVWHPDSTVRAKVFMSLVRKFLNQATEKQFTSRASLGSAMAKLLQLICPLARRPKELRKAEGQMRAEMDVDRICDLIGEGAITYSHFMRRRTLFVSADGNIGAANSEIDPGDLICNFKGLKMPFVVREKGAYHELISPAIVIWAMDGVMWPEEIVPWEIV